MNGMKNDINIEEMLKKLPELTDEMMSGVQAGGALRYKILESAKNPVKRFNWRAVCASCAALIVVIAGVMLIPSLREKNDLGLTGQAAGNGISLSETKADLPGNSLSLLSSTDVPFKSIFAKQSAETAFDLNGNQYRMLTSPASLSSNKVGSEIGTANGASVFAVKGVSGAVCMQISGKMRVFQRVSAPKNGETLQDVLGAQSVVALSLSGVGEITDAGSAQDLYDLLVSKAVYQGSSVSETNQALTITCANGVKLQMFVSGNTLMSCGAWSCPEFFEAFK